MEGEWVDLEGKDREGDVGVLIFHRAILSGRSRWRRQLGDFAIVDVPSS